MDEGNTIKIRKIVTGESTGAIWSVLTVYVEKDSWNSGTTSYQAGGQKSKHAGTVIITMTKRYVQNSVKMETDRWTRGKS